MLLVAAGRGAGLTVRGLTGLDPAPAGSLVADTVWVDGIALGVG